MDIQPCSLVPPASGSARQPRATRCPLVHQADVASGQMPSAPPVPWCDDGCPQGLLRAEGVEGGGCRGLGPLKSVTYMRRYLGGGD